MKTVITALILACSASAFAQKLDVKIVDRQDNETEYTYVVPAHFAIKFKRKCELLRQRQQCELQWFSHNDNQRLCHARASSVVPRPWCNIHSAIA